MSKKEKIDVMVEGGKATAAPPLGPALGPLKVNIGQVISEINKKTESFKGMKVPVKVIVDTESKEFEIQVGTPPVSQLIKKEIGVDTGSGTPHEHKVGNIAVEQAVKIAKMKRDAMIVNSLKSAVKSVIGSCHSLGVMVEGRPAKEIEKEIDKGKFDDIINNEVTEVSKEKQELLKLQLAKEQETYSALLAKRKAEQEAKEAAAAAAAAAAGIAAPGAAVAAPAPGTAPTAAPGATPAAGAGEAKPAPEKKEAPKKK